MAAAQDVHVRICNQEIVKFDLEVKALIQDIRDCSGPLSALTELNTQVKEKFQQLRHRIQVENHRKQMLSNQTCWRKANLTCKIAIDNLEKAELLQGGDLLRQRKTTKESLAQTSSTITESLMGISRMMAQQVQQSEEAMQTLAAFVWRLLCHAEENRPSPLCRKQKKSLLFETLLEDFTQGQSRVHEAVTQLQQLSARGQSRFNSVLTVPPSG
ncbi:vesicle transport protein SEC20 isoform X1 [Pteropus vampyrus]|uniref:Vesicle transport protein SEC20 isoform X1 n=1 Tax=Pteropus vampyrus TaxID=132908 RepID=A0A6P6D021_PTEVA|nr:vesicle transport protein SEC20 isoform X1 [Pteropus vampyrus]